MELRENFHSFIPQFFFTMPQASWLQDEVLAADFGDKRLSKRLGSIVTSFASRPNDSIPQSCGSWAASKATYNFFLIPA